MKAGTRENEGLIWKNPYSCQRDTGVNAISGNLRDDVLLGLLVLRPTAAGKLGQHILALPASPLCQVLQSPWVTCYCPRLGQAGVTETRLLPGR